MYVVRRNSKSRFIQYISCIIVKGHEEEEEVMKV
jgi:hypothetical protein